MLDVRVLFEDFEFLIFLVVECYWKRFYVFDGRELVYLWSCDLMFKYDES